jgi:ribonuclease Z
MEGKIRVLTRGVLEQGCCLELTCGNSLYLIHCPETFQRIGTQIKFKCPKLKGIFWTYINWTTAGGYSDTFMWASDLGDGSPSSLHLVGPRPLYRFLLSTLFTVYRPTFHDMKITQISSSNLPKEIPTDPLQFPIIELDAGFSIQPILIEKPNTINTEPFLDKTFIHGFDFQRKPLDPPVQDLLCYALHYPQTPGAMNAQKAKELGVPAGPLLGKLSRGEPITLENGTVILPEQCVGAATPGGVVLILSCPSEEYLEGIQQNPILQQYREQHNRGERFVLTMVHLVNLKIATHPNYVAFIQAFKPITVNGKTILHQFVFPAQEHVPLQFTSSIRLQESLSKLGGNNLFPNLFENSKENQKLYQDESKAQLSALIPLYGKTTYVGEADQTLTFFPFKKLAITATKPSFGVTLFFICFQQFLF